MKCPTCHFDNPEDTNYCGKCATPLLPAQDAAVAQTKTIKKLKGKPWITGTIAEKYEIREKLGKGGMGVVYKAEDTRLKRLVAIKLLPPELTDDLDARERFFHEARTASALDHPNICTIYEIDETKDGQMFIAMAFYPGRTLKEKIKQGLLQINEAIDIVIQVAQGLAKAHSRGIVHRDIKPANIMIGDDHVVKIVDFGLAKLAGLERLTRTSEIMGTVAYMSPEQSSGENVDHRTDLWSMGVVCYELLTGQLPFPGEDERSMMYSIINKSPIPPTELKEDIPRDAERIIFKCLRKKKDDRYQNASRLLSDLIKLQKALERKREGLVEAKKKPPKKEMERRHATVLFAEISGYNEILERMDVEEAASIMNSCLEMFDSIAQKYRGAVDEIMENSMKIIFGVPEAIEDAPKEAINAAIEMRKRLHRFIQEKNIQIPLDIHIGVNTGIVITGAIGVDEKKSYVVKGDTVTIASQLKDLSTKGKIYIGPSTYKYTRNDFDYRPLKPVTIKGKMTPFPIFELLSTKEKIYRPKLGSERMIYSEMVGRDKELDELKLHVLKVINGEGSIVNVIGEAGIGKSRLIAELKRMEDLKKVTLLEGWALSIGKNISYHPIIDIIKNWAAIREQDSKTEAFQKLEKAISTIYPEGGAEVFPFIATLMGMKLRGKYAEWVKGIEGEALEKLILKNMRELMIKGAELRPIVSIIEDLHWADLSSIELLESLFRLAKNHSILFINVFRPNYEETSDRILESIKDRYGNIHSEMHLKPLGEKQCEALIQNLIKVKGISTNIREVIVNRTEGNPFFIEEVVRSFIDDGVIEITDGHFKVTEKIDSVVIPETIHEVLMARLDKLDGETRSLLKIASVIGRNFFYKILTDVARSIEDIDDRLEYLKEGQLILERRRMEEIEYLFKHALVQEATYGSILLKKRKELHLKIANSIEVVFSERLHEFYGMLALHYSKGEDLDKAEEYLIMAGEEALKSSASSEALYYYREALKIYLRKYGDKADRGKIAMLEKNISLAFFNRGEYVEADEYFTRVLEYYGQKFPKHKISALLKSFSGLFRFLIKIYFPFLRKNKIPTHKDSEIINLYYKKNTALIFLDPVRMFIEIFYWLWKLVNFDLTKIENGTGIISMSSAAFSYGGVSFRFSRKIMEFIKDKVDESAVKSVLYYKVPEVIHNTFSGDWDKIGEYDNDLVQQNVRIGELFYASGYALTHGYSRIARGYFDVSLTLVQKLHEMAEDYENDYARAACYWFKTQVLVKFRKLHDALTVSEEGIDFTDKTGFRPYMFSLCAFKARVQIMLKGFEEAEKSLEYLNGIQSEINLVPYFLTTFFLSQLIFDLHKLEASMKDNNKTGTANYRKRALKTAKKAIKNSRKIAADITESYKLMGVFYWLTGRQKKALKWWQKGIKEGERLGARLELSRVFMEVGKRLSEKKSRHKELNGINAQQYLEKAQTLFKEMDLQWDLEELEEVGWLGLEM